MGYSDCQNYPNDHPTSGPRILILRYVLGNPPQKKKTTLMNFTKLTNELSISQELYSSTSPFYFCPWEFPTDSEPLPPPRTRPGHALSFHAATHCSATRRVAAWWPPALEAMAALMSSIPDTKKHGKTHGNSRVNHDDQWLWMLGILHHIGDFHGTFHGIPFGI